MNFIFWTLTLFWSRNVVALNCIDITSNPISPTGCNVITSLDISDVSQTELLKFSNITQITSNLKVENNRVLTSLEGLNSLVRVGGYLHVRYNTMLTSLEGLNSLSTVGGILRIERCSNLVSIEALTSLTTSRSLYVDYNSKLPSLEGLNSLTTIRQFFFIRSNPLLTTIDSLSSLTRVYTTLAVQNNPVLESISSLSGITGSVRFLYVSNNSNLRYLHGIESITPTQQLQIGSSREGPNQILDCSDVCNRNIIASLRSSSSLTGIQDQCNVSSFICPSDGDTTISIDRDSCEYTTDCTVCNRTSCDFMTVPNPRNTSSTIFLDTSEIRTSEDITFSSSETNSEDTTFSSSETSSEDTSSASSDVTSGDMISSFEVSSQPLTSSSFKTSSEDITSEVTSEDMISSFEVSSQTLTSSSSKDTSGDTSSASSEVTSEDMISSFEVSSQTLTSTSSQDSSKHRSSTSSEVTSVSLTEVIDTSKDQSSSKTVTSVETTNSSVETTNSGIADYCTDNQCDIIDDKNTDITIFQIETLSLDNDILILGDHKVTITNGNLSFATESILKIELQKNMFETPINITNGCLDGKNGDLEIDIKDYDLKKDTKIDIIKYDCVITEFDSVSIINSEKEFICFKEQYGKSTYSVLMGANGLCLSASTKFQINFKTFLLLLSLVTKCIF